MALFYPRLFCFPDYLYYRITNWFGTHDDGSRTGVILSAMYTAPFFAAATWTVYARMGAEGVNHHLKLLTILAMAVFALVMLLNYFRYRDSDAQLAARWGQQGPGERTLKTTGAVAGWQILCCGSFAVVHYLPF